ncbi:uncharacterized protein (DUF4415 family) [Halospina denitrificans]|uniref:Uncharacterized protein (DUF4415 family) n=1 Tax=Halospina denitrificans TaxID=332522 RepID=A0A4R7K0D1_9GAMM|nr:BrnA antitoxin family protein [Halospina denitrificans]TDT43303.1 uncharacterized protein (DUF4415 family) [Halospina denitrificans]
MPAKKTRNHNFEVPDEDEDARINAGIDADPDTYELSEDEFRQLKPVGRPKAEVTKERVTIRLSPEVVAYFRSQGKGWQTRIDEALKAMIREDANH